MDVITTSSRQDAGGMACADQGHATEGTTRGATRPAGRAEALSTEAGAAESLPPRYAGRPAVANIFELVAITAVVAFLLGGVFGVIFIVANGIRAEEKGARERARARQRATTLYDESTSNLTRGVRWMTGSGHDSRN